MSRSFAKSNAFVSLSHNLSSEISVDVIPQGAAAGRVLAGSLGAEPSTKTVASSVISSSITLFLFLSFSIVSSVPFSFSGLLSINMLSSDVSFSCGNKRNRKILLPILI